MRALLLLIAFILAASPAFAGCNGVCPSDKFPTELQLYIQKDSSGAIRASAALISIDLSGKAAIPISREKIFFQMCAFGNFEECPTGFHRCGPVPQDYWQCSSGCCGENAVKETDDDGKATALFTPVENATVAAVYPGGDTYLPTNSSAAYLYPPLYGALNISACFPLVLIIGLLLVTFSALGFRKRFR